MDLCLGLAASLQNLQQGWETPEALGAGVEQGLLEVLTALEVAQLHHRSSARSRDEQLCASLP